MAAISLVGFGLRAGRLDYQSLWYDEGSSIFLSHQSLADITQGTAAGLRTLSTPAGAKTGSAEDPAAPGTGVDAWYTAALSVVAPEIVVTVFVHGGGEGHLTAEPVARRILDYYLAHRVEIAATPPAAEPATSSGL